MGTVIAGVQHIARGERRGAGGGWGSREEEGQQEGVGNSAVGRAAVHFVRIAGEIGARVELGEIGGVGLVG